MPLYSRKNMPQVNTQNLSKALSMAKSKVKVTKGLVSARKLKESQVELIPNKVKGIAAKYSKPTDMLKCCHFSFYCSNPMKLFSSR